MHMNLKMSFRSVTRFDQISCLKQTPMSLLSPGLEIENICILFVFYKNSDFSQY